MSDGRRSARRTCRRPRAPASWRARQTGDSVGTWRRLVGRHLEPHAPVRREAVEVVDDVEARRALRVVGAADVDQVGEAVLELEAEATATDGVARDLQRQIAGERARAD